jgi:hypothetical protein
VVATAQGRYRLSPDLVEVDYTRVAQAQTDRRTATTPQDRRAALQAMIDTYAGPLAEGMSAAWLDPVREALRRDAVDAVDALARVLVSTDPEQTLELLEIARAFDPFNELLYSDIMRLQARLGRLDAIPRTLALLTTRLAELDDHPSPGTVQLAERLCQPRRHTASTPAPQATFPAEPSQPPPAITGAPFLTGSPAVPRRSLELNTTPRPSTATNQARRKTSTAHERISRALGQRQMLTSNRQEVRGTANATVPCDIP